MTKQGLNPRDPSTWVYPGTAARRLDRPWPGLVVYALFTFAFSWLPAALLHWLWQSERAPVPLRLVISAATYALCMGWQPLVATWMVRRWVDRVNLDDILRGSQPRFYGIATVAPLLLAGLAMGILLLAQGSAASTHSGLAMHGWGMLLLAALSICAGLVLIWIQALAEEVGWRGYFLPRFMAQIGPVPGLAFHGVIWGLWYAPILLMSTRGAPVSGVSGASFVFTCMLLGGLLGWLRLASRSVVPATLANSLLTVSAGLPFLVEGADPGLRAAVYGPAGWLPMSVLLVVLLTTRLRREVRTPTVELVDSQSRVWVVVVPPDSEPPPDRTLH
jgi:membrane protease YdiL (CAAX protease family)